jgi:hypothetical protein
MQNKNGHTAEEIAESYINGNISWCREQIKKNAKLALEVQQILNEIAPEYGKTFYRTM